MTTFEISLGISQNLSLNNFQEFNTIRYRVNKSTTPIDLEIEYHGPSDTDKDTLFGKIVASFIGYMKEGDNQRCVRLQLHNDNNTFLIQRCEKVGRSDGISLSFPEGRKQIYDYICQFLNTHRNLL